MHSMKVGPTASQRMSEPVSCSGTLASTSNEPVSTKIVALDKADEGKNGDDQYVVTAERDAVELASEQIAGARYRSRDRADFCHGDPPRLVNRGTMRCAKQARRRVVQIWNSLRLLCYSGIDASRVLAATNRRRIDVLLLFEEAVFLLASLPRTRPPVNVVQRCGIVIRQKKPTDRRPAHPASRPRVSAAGIRGRP